MNITLPDTLALRSAAIIVMIALAVGIIVYAQFRNSIKFNFWDLLLDPTTRRASLDNTITLACCTVGMWYAIVKAYDANFDKSNSAGSFLTSLITIMVVSRAARHGIQAYGDRERDRNHEHGRDCDRGSSWGRVDAPTS